jgi:hypothetical protein
MKTAPNLHRFATTALIAMALALTGCKTMAQAAPKADPLTVQKEIAIARINAEGVRTTALMKLADKTDSEFAHGLLAGLIVHGGGQAAAQSPVNINVPAERDWLDRTLQVGQFLLNPLDMVLDYRRDKRAQEHAADKYKLTLDALGGAQVNSYDFARDVNARKTEFFVLPPGAAPVETAAETPAE